MTWLVLANPAAGRRTPSVAEIADGLRAGNIDHELAVTMSPAEADSILAEAVVRGFDRFAAVGGDGTLSAMLNALMAAGIDRRPLLAMLPAGSGTDLIRTFALSRSLEEGIARLAACDRYTMDVGLIEPDIGERRWFLNVADFGVAAAAAVTATRVPRWVGPVRYAASFWLTLPRFHPAAVQVAAERRTVRVEALNVVVANGQFFGGGMHIAPQAAISDGLLDAEVFAAPRRNAFSVMPRVIRGLHLRLPSVTTLRAARFEIDVPPSWPIEADGDLVGHGPATVSVVPGAVDLAI